ncbi:MAG: deoxyribonuclease IV [Armatimonadota bacterium]|nr:deoxyribonuclease IV [bacterium]
MRLGVHIRIAQGLVKALDRALELECETVQLFSGNPNSWTRTPLNPVIAAEFYEKTSRLSMRPIIVHTPYLLNLASPEDDIWHKSREALADAVRRAALLGAEYIVTHIGSHKGAGYEVGIKRIHEAVRYALDADPHPTIALELGAGAGNSIGSRFEHIGDILDGMSDVIERVGICIDTAHLWGSGYDISSEEGVLAMFGELDKYVGLDRLKVVHLNDTQKDLGSHADRHYHIGLGQIGEEGFRAILHHPFTANLPGIIETPGGDDLEQDRANLAVLRRLRK